VGIVKAYDSLNKVHIAWRSSGEDVKILNAEFLEHELDWVFRAGDLVKGFDFAGTHFTCFAGTNAQMLTLKGFDFAAASAAAAAAAAAASQVFTTQFTCLTDTKVQILTQLDAASQRIAVGDRVRSVGTGAFIGT
jgi:hypothetical protein